MSSAKKRKNRPRVPRDDSELQPQLPPRPEYLQIAPGHVIWRNSIQPDPEQPFQQVTWDVRFLEDRITIRADLANEGEMRELDFRDVKGKLDEIINTQKMAIDSVGWHMERIRQSVFWQRIPKPSGVHLDRPFFHGDNGSWSFALLMEPDVANLRQWVGHPVLRRASNEMYLMRQEERQWLSYGRRNSEWADFLSLDEDMCGCFRVAVCRMRLMHYWQIPECRQLFLSSKKFTVLFCADGLLPALEDLSDPDWRTNATKLARLPRRELLALAGLPATEQVVRLFERLKAWDLAANWPLIRLAFANPLAIERLCETTCGIDEMMLSICSRKDFPFHWPLFRELCSEGETYNSVLSYIHRDVNFLRDGEISQSILKSYLNAKTTEDIRRVRRHANFLRWEWFDLFKAGVQDAIRNLTPPLSETESIRLINRPLKLIELSMLNDLMLGQYLIPITQGEYALYQINYEGEFAVAGIQRTENKQWEIDQIKGHNNADPSEALALHVAEWQRSNAHVL